ncbi:MAG: hypothetical protein IJI45_15900 [Anaerolineaceae bacterium]|nr:hypothetical protein [Anaerolineaceae bacterium]
MKFIRNIILLAAGLIVISFVQSPAYADRTEFLETLTQLKTSGIIPNIEEDQVISYGSFSDIYANMGSTKYYTITESDHFVLSSKIFWNSASPTPNGSVSGCGYVFGTNQDTKDHLMVSIRMDGNLYFNGRNLGSPLSYGKTFIQNPSMQGEALLTLVVNGSSVNIFFNGNNIKSRNDVVLPGNGLGFSILSGTNKDFGTQCTFDDIFLYTWQDEIQ